VLKRGKRARKKSEPKVDWRDHALRLQAEMENYRHRQQQLTETCVAQEKAALLLKFLPIVDDLGRTLIHLSPDAAGQPGVQSAYNAFQTLLRLENITVIPTVNEAFDPAWHEAVAMVPADTSQVEDMLIVEEQRSGYRWGKRLLRPAQVIVAKK